MAEYYLLVTMASPRLSSFFASATTTRICVDKQTDTTCFDGEFACGRVVSSGDHRQSEIVQFLNISNMASTRIIVCRQADGHDLF